MAGFAGLLMAGKSAGVAVSAADASKSVLALEETAVFGKGASGLVDSTSPDRSAEGLAVASISAAEVATGVRGVQGASPEIVLQHIRTSVVRIKNHLSDCRPGGRGAGLTATVGTLLYHRTGCHWTFGHGS